MLDMICILLLNLDVCCVFGVRNSTDDGCVFLNVVDLVFGFVISFLRFVCKNVLDM